MLQNTKLLFMRYFQNLCSCDDFDITIVSLYDAGGNSQQNADSMNPWVLWIPQGKEMPKHVKLKHFAIPTTTTISFLKLKSQELFKKKGGYSSFHDIYVLQWWLSLPIKEREAFHSIWVVEDGTFYNGDLCSFLSKYTSQQWDYLSSASSPAENWPQKDFTTFQYPSEVFYHASDHVVGMTGRLLNLIQKALMSDILLHSEAFGVTLCKSESTHCRLATIEETIVKQDESSNHIDYRNYRNLIQHQNNLWYHGFTIDFAAARVDRVLELKKEIISAEVLKIMGESLSDVSEKEREFLQEYSQEHKLEFKYSSLFCFF